MLIEYTYLNIEFYSDISSFYSIPNVSNLKIYYSRCHYKLFVKCMFATSPNVDINLTTPVFNELQDRDRTDRSF